MPPEYIEEKIKEFKEIANNHVGKIYAHTTRRSDTKWLIQALTQTHNNALKVAVESLPEIDDTRKEYHPDYVSNGSVILNNRSVEIALHNATIDYHKINTQLNYRDQAIKNIKEKMI
jgi:hypothetical protein